MTSTSNVPFYSVLLLLFLGGVFPYHSGAPDKACETMIPGHGSASESGADSYKITAEKQPDQSVKVTLEGTFKGFFIQAKRSDNIETLVPGKFVPGDSVIMQAVDCGGHDETAVTHKDGSVKSEVAATWTPPANWEGTVVFRATVVQDYSNYVERILSDPVMITKSPQSGDGRGQEESTTPASVAYVGCGQTMGCFGTPKGCLKRGSCSMLLTYVARGDGVDFELMAPAKHDQMWTAAGISETPSMDMASVVECYRHNGAVHMRESWNTEKYRNVMIENQTPGLTFTRSEYTNGMLHCSWHRAHVTSVRKTTFNTGANSYHLLLAAGLFEGSSDAKKEHYERDYTKTPYNLKAMQVAVGGAEPDIFIKLHGSLMIVAWVLLVSVGMLLARHYKNVWEATTICGVKPWFAFHRVLMMLAVALTIAAIALIFYKIGQWSVTENPHPILGIVCAALGVCQPIMALFRCHPHEDNRYIFNWLHWFNGNAAQIIGVAAIFFATSLEKAQLKGADWFVYILAAFVGFHVLVHIVMQLHAVFMSKKEKHTITSDIKMQDMAAGNGVHAAEAGRDLQPPATDAPGGGFRRFILGIYLVVAILVVAALVSTIWISTAP